MACTTGQSHGLTPASLSSRRPINVGDQVRSSTLEPAMPVNRSAARFHSVICTLLSTNTTASYMLSSNLLWKRASTPPASTTAGTVETVPRQKRFDCAESSVRSQWLTTFRGDCTATCNSTNERTSSGSNCVPALRNSSWAARSRGMCAAIHLVARHGVESVCDRQHSRAERNLSAHQRIFAAQCRCTIRPNDGSRRARLESRSS